MARLAILADHQWLVKIPDLNVILLAVVLLKADFNFLALFSFLERTGRTHIEINLVDLVVMRLFPVCSNDTHAC